MAAVGEPRSVLARLLEVRPWRALQVEVTSHCTRRCAICPRTTLAAHWSEIDLAPELWRRLVPDLSLFRHVHLQGWGEPLLHPGLRGMVRDARRAGCQVGLTTNADLLADAADWIAEESVDVVSVSVGGGPEWHARERDGADLERTWHAVAALARARRRRPRIQVAYLLTVDNAPDLPDVVTAAAEAGADELYVTHLDVTPSQELLDRAAFNGGGLRSGVGVAVDRAAAAARDAGIAFRPPTERAEEPLTCALDPTRFVAVGAGGRVGPCVNLLLPVEGPVPRSTPAGPERVEPVVYGDLRRSTVRELVDGPGARAFRAPFAVRRRCEQRFLASLGGHGARALRELERADRVREAELSEAPFPAACRGCHKAHGW